MRLFKTKINIICLELLVASKLSAAMPVQNLVNTNQAMPEIDWGIDNDQEWCESGYECATLEFCEDNASGAFAYRLTGETCGGIPPPLLRIQAGGKYILRLHNKASEEANLHPHGLHISGDGNADDVTRHANSGECLFYYWEIPDDHMSGTYWYHAHIHGRTDAHVSGGAYGMLIVEEDGNGDISIAPSNGNGIERWLERDHEILLVATKNGSDRYGNKISGGPTFQLVPNEWYRLRVVTADPSGKYMYFNTPSGCEARAVAHDGVWRFGIPRESSDEYTQHAGSRVDLAIKCPAGDYELKLGNGGAATVSTFSVDNSHGITTNASPFLDDGVSSWEYKDGFRPFRLTDFSGDASTFANGFEIQKVTISMTASQINGVKWPNQLPTTTPIYYGRPQEWTIDGSNAHPYHIHIYHMQVQNDCGDAHEVGQFYDSIQGGSGCIVRFWTIGFGERVVMHCHVLPHEDNGAITWINVTDNGSGMESMTPQSRNNRDSVSCVHSTPAPSPAPTPVPTFASTTPAPVPVSVPSPAPTMAPTETCLAKNQNCMIGMLCCNGGCKNSGKCP